VWSKIRDFFKGVIIELKRISWTPRKELIGATAAVLVLTILMTLMVLGLDTVFGFALKNLLLLVK